MIVPTKFRVRLHQRVGDGVISSSRKVDIDVEINNCDGTEPKWFEHPLYGSQVDVIVIEAGIPNDAKMQATFKTVKAHNGFQHDYIAAAMDAIYVVGYPWGLDGGDGVLPLFKRGSVASEPIVDYGGLPRVLIDCRTSPSMSGAMVICAHSGLHTASGNFFNDGVFGTVENFLGVYSGRYYSKDAEPLKAQEPSEIGIVWKRHVIDEIISARQVGAPV